MQARLPMNVPGTGQIDKVIEEMHREFRSLMLQKAVLARRIGTIKRTIKGLASLLGEDIVGEELSEIVDRKSSTRTRGFTKTDPALVAHNGDPSGGSSSLEVPPDGSSLEFRGQSADENPRMAKDSEGRMDPPAKSQESR